MQRYVATTVLLAALVINGQAAPQARPLVPGQTLPGLINVPSLKPAEPEYESRAPAPGQVAPAPCIIVYPDVLPSEISRPETRPLLPPAFNPELLPGFVGRPETRPLEPPAFTPETIPGVISRPETRPLLPPAFNPELLPGFVGRPETRPLEPPAFTPETIPGVISRPQTKPLLPPAATPELLPGLVGRPETRPLIPEIVPEVVVPCSGFAVMPGQVPSLPQAKPLEPEQAVPRPNPGFAVRPILRPVY